ncbi:MAG: thioredoxin domain-containing protein [Candidatus Moraniibacteriota bacterium]
MKWEIVKNIWHRFVSEKKNLYAGLIILLGLFTGSLFVDIGQLLTGSGFSGPAIRSHDVLVAGGKTWVSYTEPRVSLKIVSDEQCAECDPSEALLWLRRIVPTVEAERIDITTEVGQQYAAAFHLVTIPAFVFGNTVKETEFYTQAEPLFREKNGQMIFDMNMIGMPIGRYLVAPETGEGDITIGPSTAPVTLMVFSDFQCQYCMEYHVTYKKLLTEYGDRVRLVWKHLPLAVHPQAEKAAEAAQCAAAQDQFMPYADILFERQGEWGKAGGERRFKDYAWRIRGLDGRAFARCIDEKTFAQKVAADMKLATDFHLESAPASFVNREFVSGAAPYADLKMLIDAALAQ